MKQYYNQYSRRNLLILFAFFILHISVSYAASGIKGVVTAVEKNEKLPGVSILAENKTGTVTDENGVFRLDLSVGIHTITFSYISYQTVIKTVTVTETGYTELNVTLKDASRTLDVVVVSAGKFEQKLEDVTVSMEVLKPNLVEAKNTTELDEIMDQVPGVNIIDGQANIRGGSGWSYGAGSRVQILVDDLPQLTADANDAKWNFLPVENLEQIEVIKGASSVLFGSSALNGVINVRTAYPRDTPQTKITVFSGVYDKAKFTINDTTYDLNKWSSATHRNSGISFSHSRKIGQLDLVAGGNMFLDEGYRQGENENRARFNAGLRYRFKHMEGLSVGVNVNTMYTVGTLFFLFKNDTTGAFQPAANTLSDYTTKRTNIDPNVTYVGKNGSTHKLRTRWFNTTNENNTNQGSTANLLYAEYQYQKRFGEKFVLSGGAVKIKSTVKSELYKDHDGSQTAAYVQGDLKWKRFTFSAGGRVEQNKVDTVKDAWTPVFRSGVNFHPFGETYFRASAGQGYRFPSIAEKFVRTNIGAIDIFPNPNLSSEKGLSMEVGVKQGIRIGKWNGFIDAAVFRNEYKNMIEFSFGHWETTGSFFGNGFKSANIGNTRIDGLELSIMGTGKIAGELTMTVLAGYTYLKPIQLTFDSSYVNIIGAPNIKGSDSTDFLKYRFKHMAKADVEFGWRKLKVGMSWRFTSRMENIDNIFVNGLIDFGFPPGLGIGYYRKYHRGGDSVFDSRVSYELTKNLSLALIVKNVFNYIYMQRPADVQPQRTTVCQLSVRF